MPYDPGLAERLAGVVASHAGMEQKKMFGGIGWLLNGHMCVGVYREYLIARVGENEAASLLRNAHVKIMDITGRPMKGWLMIAPDGYEDDPDLRRYTKAAIDYVDTLPAKA